MSLVVKIPFNFASILVQGDAVLGLNVLKSYDFVDCEVFSSFGSMYLKKNRLASFQNKVV